MALATYKDLCIDAVDHEAMASFWARLLGLTVVDVEATGARLVGPTSRHTVWVNRVPEPVTVKQRVHLDVHVGALADALALGATPLDVDSFTWQVLRDPEGGELCVFEREQVPDYRLYEVVVDVGDSVAAAAWWAGVLGARAQQEQDWSAVDEIPGAPFECLVFQEVPEPRQVKNRIHWDVTVPDLEGLVAAGATVVRRRDAEIRWTVLADPQGNEFCAFEESS
jgi:catechol-2,3-dioxygenase